MRRSEENRSGTIVAIDETGFLSIEAPNRGYSKRGCRLRVSKQQRNRIHLSCVMAIDNRGGVKYAMKNASCNGWYFQQFVRSIGSHPKGSTVVMDNIAFHKSSRVRHLLQRRGLKVMYTPPYSPECNPIELFFSCVKHQLRKIMTDLQVSSEAAFVNVASTAIERAKHSCNVSSFFSLPEVV